ncbi:MAG: hypothetical protein IPJ82_19235 [Lewinellaceae bacterium]|nr:hypothetical protein [Lewinellaceae bacterium]
MKKLLEITGLILIGIFYSIDTNAQLQNTWVGGTPGRPIDWNLASNWSLQRVPDAFHDVVIPNTSTTTFSYPSINHSIEINSLTIESGAKMVILEKGHLKLLRPGTMDEALANKGLLDNRSRHFIEFDRSVYESSDSLVADKKQ